MQKFKVLTTGGGTAGHIYPILAVVAELRKLATANSVNLDVRYLGACGQFRKALKENGIKVRRVAGAKLRRYFSLQNFIDIPKFIWSICQALWKVYWYMPDILFSKGGPGSLPVVLAARFYHIPVIVHESDALLSLNSRLALPFADIVAVAFESTLANVGEKGTHTGNPIRQFLLAEPLPQEKAKSHFGFNPTESLLFVMGGSQGAEAINDFVLDVLPELLKITQVLHQTGSEKYRSVVAEAGVVTKTLPVEIKRRYKATDYFDKDLITAMQAADLIMARAGASVSTEIAFFRKPSILIPLPVSVTTRQQEVNAFEFQKAGAALVMEQNNLLPNVFLNNVRDLLHNSEERARMADAATRFYKADAASNLARIILRYS